jgi:hypothetical protein
VAVAHLAAASEQRVGFVEEEHGVPALGGIEELLEILLGLADELVDDLTQV